MVFYLEPANKLNWREAPKNEGAAKKRGSKATEDLLCLHNNIRI